MHDFQEQCQVQHNAFVLIFFKTMYNKTIIKFSFCDIRNNQGLSKCYQPRPSASADNTYLDLDYSGYHKNKLFKAGVNMNRREI